MCLSCVLAPVITGLCCDFREEAVHVLGFDVSEEELKRGLTTSTQRY